MKIDEIDNFSTVMFAKQTAQVEQTDFSTWMVDTVQETNAEINAAEVQVQKLALGEAENLHQVMLSITKAKTSFEMMVKVRNKMLEGYQELMRTSI